MVLSSVIVKPWKEEEEERGNKEIKKASLSKEQSHLERDKQMTKRAEGSASMERERAGKEKG